VNNLTEVTEFFLVGFQVSHGLRIFLFCLLLVIYWGTLCGNLLIMTLVSTSRNLRTPMYFFISQLSIGDLLVFTDIVPNMLHILLKNGATITFIGCISQLFLFCGAEVFECFLLTVMSYDRYVAICNPLRYTSIMTVAHCVKLSITCWLIEFSIILIYFIKISNIIFCVPILFIPITIIVISYINIILAVLRIPSSTGRQKAFSTCSSHLIVVSIFYWAIFSVYTVPTKGQTLTISKILSLLYTVFTPFINPIIYSLRNRDIRKAVQELLHKCGIH
ncbi:hypothetical protein GDO81_004045, partial [Engystomops pustulosus]